MRVCKIRCATTRSSLLAMNKTYPTEKQEKDDFTAKKEEENIIVCTTSR
jgi:hypothetical protein